LVHHHPTSGAARAATHPTSGAAVTSTVRFMEMNVLPEARVHRAEPTVRFREMNLLPEALSTVIEHHRLIDMNVLPGDDARDLPPSSDQRGGRY